MALRYVPRTDMAHRRRKAETTTPEPTGLTHQERRQMSSDKKFGMLRNILRAMGLSQEAADDVVDFIVERLVGEGKATETPTSTPKFPYLVRDDFLSAAELSYFKVLQTVVGTRGVLFTKVGLRDLFYVKLEDRSEFRTYTNKIDRKHVDFLLCDSVTLRPILGIELDDKSHQRADRQERDAFVDEVFSAAGLPLLHVPVKRAYTLESVTQQLLPYLEKTAISPDISPPPIVESRAETTTSAPRCPKCGSEMILRTSKKAGNQFWGCSQYPQCRGVIAIDP